MENNTDLKSRSKLSKVLFIITTIYGILYVILVITSFFEDINNSEVIIVYAAFIVFLIGYYFTFKNEMTAGIIFLFWWGIMWYLGLFIAEQDKGAGVVMGIPLFIVAVLYIISAKKNKKPADE